MKIKFVTAPKGRDYKVGQVVEFKGKVEETYALKFLSRGWAEPFDEAAAKAAEKASRDEQAEKDKQEADAKLDAEAKAKVLADAEAKSKVDDDAKKAGGNK